MCDCHFSHSGIVGLNNIKANDYLNVVLQVRDIVLVIILKYFFVFNIIHRTDVRAMHFRHIGNFIFLSLELKLSSKRVSCFFLQALAFIPPVRDFFLREENYQNIKRPPGDIMFPLGKQVRIKYSSVFEVFTRFLWHFPLPSTSSFADVDEKLCKSLL